MRPRDDVIKLLSAAINTKYNLTITPEVSCDSSAHGDFSTNIAFSLSRRLKLSPILIAREIVEVLSSDKVSQKIAVAPGFINITLKDEVWQQQLDNFDHKFLLSPSASPQKIQVEFISANPTGPLTLGNARGGFIGDVLSNVLSSQGHEVVREYYFNNAGTQMMKLVESVKIAAGLIESDERQYSGVYIDKLAVKFKKQLKQDNDSQLKKLLSEAIFKEYIAPAVKKMGIEFDVWFNEQDLIDDGTFATTLDLLKDKGLIFARDGAIWVNTESGGDPRKARVIIKSSGDPTYLAPDIAYHVNIFGKRKFDRAIKELGPDHIAQFPSVKAAISQLYPDKIIEMVDHQQLRLIKDGKEFKMSKRLGQFVTVDELVDRVGSDVARWFMLMRSSDTHMDFDLDIAEEQSQKNPFWYVMYAYVRATSIIRQASAKGMKAATSARRLSREERAIVVKLSQLPDIITQISISYEVHKLTFYGTELAKLFHEWYEKTDQVINLDHQSAAEKLWFLQQFILVMEQYFNLMGIKPHDRM